MSRLCIRTQGQEPRLFQARGADTIFAAAGKCWGPLWQAESSLLERQRTRLSIHACRLHMRLESMQRDRRSHLCDSRDCDLGHVETAHNAYTVRPVMSSHTRSKPEAHNASPDVPSNVPSQVGSAPKPTQPCRTVTGGSRSTAPRTLDSSASSTSCRSLSSRLLIQDPPLQVYL